MGGLVQAARNASTWVIFAGGVVLGLALLVLGTGRDMVLGWLRV
jgi:hypothetical protein